MKLPNFMIIGPKIRKLQRGRNSPPPGMPDSEKLGLFKVKVRMSGTCLRGFSGQNCSEFKIPRD